ncbi:MAG: hypothetical protein JWM53_3860, partial [bacterium]|nr:hypothetical protein [bacterium]
MPRRFVLVALVIISASRIAAAAPLLFRNVRIFDGARVSQGDVLVDQGKIRAIDRKL